MNIEQHKLAGQIVSNGINFLLNSNKVNAPSPLDMFEILDILDQKIQESKQYIGIPFYVPVRKGSTTRTEHEFKRDIMGEMKELLLNPDHPYDSTVDHTLTIKFLVSPIMNRLGLFDHSVAISAAPTVINNAKQFIIQES